MNPASDPRFTAYADGVLPPGDSRRFEKELAADPAARAELDQIRELQRGLREAFEGIGSGTGPGAVVEPGRVAKRERAATGAVVCSRGFGWIGSLFVAVCVVIVGATLASTSGKPRGDPVRDMAGSNLRRIGQACLIYSEAHEDRWPEAPDVWEFARILAVDGGLKDASRWSVETDPAAKDDGDLSSVLAGDGRTLDPEFAVSKPACAVVLGGITLFSPATTPVAWTRGLRPDGTWSADSPFGGVGGHVVFLSGETRFFPSGQAEFVGRDGRKTKNIHDALPEGARVGEYTPTAAESRLWSKQPRALPRSVWRAQVTQTVFYTMAGVVFAGACVWQVVRRRFRTGEILMAALVAVLFLLLGVGMGR